MTNVERKNKSSRGSRYQDAWKIDELSDAGYAVKWQPRFPSSIRSRPSGGTRGLSVLTFLVFGTAVLRTSLVLALHLTGLWYCGKRLSPINRIRGLFRVSVSCMVCISTFTRICLHANDKVYSDHNKFASVFHPHLTSVQVNPAIPSTLAL